MEIKRLVAEIDTMLKFLGTNKCTWYHVIKREDMRDYNSCTYTKGVDTILVNNYDITYSWGEKNLVTYSTPLTVELLNGFKEVLLKDCKLKAKTELEKRDIGIYLRSKGVLAI
jgi:hypothetical protein